MCVWFVHDAVWLNMIPIWCVHVMFKLFCMICVRLNTIGYVLSLAFVIVLLVWLSITVVWFGMILYDFVLCVNEFVLLLYVCSIWFCSIGYDCNDFCMFYFLNYVIWFWIICIWLVMILLFVYNVVLVFMSLYDVYMNSVCFSIMFYMIAHDLVLFCMIVYYVCKILRWLCMRVSLCMDFVWFCTIWYDCKLFLYDWIWLCLFVFEFVCMNLYDCFWFWMCFCKNVCMLCAWCCTMLKDAQGICMIVYVLNVWLWICLYKSCLFFVNIICMIVKFVYDCVCVVCVVYDSYMMCACYV